MKVILLEDVYKQGVAGEMVDVAPGYARNYLVPRKLAVQATRGAMRQFENLSKQAEVRREQQHQKNSELATRIEALTLAFPVKAGETGKLYGSVTGIEIAEQLAHQLGLEIDRRRVGDRPLRDLGTFSVPVRLDGGVVSHVRVIVHREGENPLAVEDEPVLEEETGYEYEEQVYDEAPIYDETEAEEDGEA
jgi:large subunit ribosomal protein L9